MEESESIESIVHELETLAELLPEEERGEANLSLKKLLDAIILLSKSDNVNPDLKRNVEWIMKWIIKRRESEIKAVMKFFWFTDREKESIRKL